MNRNEFNTSILALKEYISAQSYCENIELVKGMIATQSDSLKVRTRLFQVSDSVIGPIDLDLEILITFSESYEAPTIFFRIYIYRQEELAEERKLSFERHILELVVGTDSAECGLRVPYSGKNPNAPNADNKQRDFVLDDIDELIDDGSMSDMTIKRGERVYGGGPSIEITDYDNFGVYYFIHPCQTRQLMDQVGDFGSESLLKWWNFYSGPILWRFRIGSGKSVSKLSDKANMC
ncbi:hypothetical protein HII12_004170 [Brettanomyces bruxellensis]|uniref:DEBR0S1_18052g1_1 n=1 Tax=Dekkera bruxellensis TaxID=5007 RepID=A0A7D9CYD5_DEKBR|nr:hypothetical protein HII12_004170 [Brettanomyces bruxellensis]VUG16492.1 DEBR0S1_18052g1_1 [Brettanomyces bruxellensis]